MEQVPYLCDGIYSKQKQKSTVPNFLSIGECCVTDDCKHMAWLGENGWKEGTCSKNLPVCPKLAFAITSIQCWCLLFSSHLVSLYLKHLFAC